MTSKESKKDKVRDFWNRNVNQFNQLLRDDVGTREFYDAAEALRYQYHYHLPPLFDKIASEFPHGKLLEIGCSMGNDTMQLARRGMKVTGIDITQTAIDLITERFLLFEMSGDFQVADAENLPFEDNTFDVVYSFGVLHHTPDTVGAIEEARRVLRPNGKAFVMLYNTCSLNWLAHRLTGIPFDGSRAEPCPVEKSYMPFSAKKLFKNYTSTHLSVDYLFGTGWGQGNRFMPIALHRLLGRVIGWHLMIEAVK
ncbi:class I SAM-dependent methyltransferase [Desulfogranum japonicum]|uniref:class I SAM-dependent methyltransferase n=1 Tax=Desulfogranum japonicum TaxID=231447 RepID=UPI00048A7B75|nr:class I SAM-dependent methyltransferase [Desulfogranum japonicum]